MPDCFEITRECCEYSFGILIIDGKYIKVRGYKEKIPYIYLIDYLTHDILFGVLARAESEEAFLDIFKKLKQLNYPLKIIVSDDRSSLPIALKQVYPNIQNQLCINHYLENIRKNLNVRTDPTHRRFFNSLKKHVFEEYENDEKLNKALIYISDNHCKNIPVRQRIILEIDQRRKELFAYKNFPDCPNNTNLIELFNSHFNIRLKALKGFKNLNHAKLWLNGLVIRRRTKPFTDCGPKFKHLNGKSSLQMSIKKQAYWPEIPGLKAPKR
ncbi:transposase [Patescibacteria group bacterium]|nr:transposase [Patescibacteria group bacterium]MBU4452960.1 transposase [Patescibacteria group bacterium]MCG2687597.1 transposase [Candidatus Parcubacteria bacterium]